MAAARVNVFAVVAAAGFGRRMGGTEKKQFLALAGRPLLIHTLERLHSWPRLRGSVVVSPPGEVERVRGMVEGAGLTGVLDVVPGGAERQESVYLGVAALVSEAQPAENDVVFIHDAARPFPPTQLFDALLAEVFPDGALLALPCTDTLKRETDGAVAGTVDRAALWHAQTPQAFPFGLLCQALESARKQAISGTDEASLVERLGRHPRLVPGVADNFKITRAEDLALAESVAARSHALQVGHGYDVHRLAPGRRLILGGVELEYPLGLLGHSDADVLSHAVADACLGAAGEGDIGRWFPDTDSKWKGVSSLELLAEVSRGLVAGGYVVKRVDATLVAEKPKVAQWLPRMEHNLSAALGLRAGTVTVKATTTEGLGFEGRGEGISAHAVALLLGPTPRR